MTGAAQRPRVTVAALLRQGDRFLLVEERAGGRLVLNQPAGHVEAGETLEEAVVRETLEESAWGFRPTSLVGIYLGSNPARERVYLRAVYAGDALGHEPGRALDLGIVRTRWLTRNEIAAAGPRLRSPVVLRCVEDFLAGRTYPLSVVSSLLETPGEAVRHAG